MTPRRELFVLLLAAALASAGCAGKHIVRAAPPSVIEPPPEETAPKPQPPTPAPAETKTEPAPEPAPATPPATPAKRPTPRPKPAQPEVADPTPAPKPAPPQISPQLSAKDLALAKTNTTENITTAEKNLQLTNGKQLSASQKDLVGKISGFLGQAHEAIVADDWVRAQNLAEKARVLSVELTKSF